VGWGQQRGGGSVGSDFVCARGGGDKRGPVDECIGSPVRFTSTGYPGDPAAGRCVTDTTVWKGLGESGVSFHEA
jgi:hypothetical protein